MLVITRYRPVATIDLTKIVADVTAVSKLTKPIEGTSLPSIYYNECGCEIVLITRVECFADIDDIEDDEINTRIGLLLLKAGLVLSSVDHLREFPGDLPELAKAFKSLKVARK
jgi:hypothetical protein